MIFKKNYVNHLFDNVFVHQLTQDVVFLQLPDSYIITHLSGSNFSGSSQNSGSLWIAKTGNVSSVSFGIFIPLMSISSKFDLLILVTKYLFLKLFFQYLDYRKSLHSYIQVYIQEIMVLQTLLPEGTNVKSHKRPYLSTLTSVYCRM